jgi:hypothetical protein
MNKPVCSQDCRHWDYCSAPICPLEDKVKNLNYIWYPEDEEICRLKSVPKWVKTQRKISKKHPDKDKYFTFEMLNRNIKVGNGIIGLDPDKEESPQLKNWFKKHPIKKQISESERKRISELGKRMQSAMKERKKISNLQCLS